MLARRVIAVEGVVQGVGFRPYVHRLAVAHHLRGFVRNDAGGVYIDVEGDGARIDDFCRILPLAPPPLASIARVNATPAPPQSYDIFRIAASDAAAANEARAPVPPDAPTCDACVADLFDPANRRFGYAFTTCTDCGPRFTVVQDTPYDRERTTMSQFALCARCQREYADPGDRRFHAESISCPDCGPHLSARDATGGQVSLPGDEAIDSAVTCLKSGGIVALKALGGFHLACDATDAAAVQRLRERKHRPAKPFAVMVRDAGAAALLCELTAAHHSALTSSARPVVLVARREVSAVAASVAPGTGTLGVMLPSTPLHHLLLARADVPLVMTSGNRGGDPVVTHDAGAFAQLGDIADLFVTHDRGIAVRCDDSVVQVAAGAVRTVRRSRGYAPGSMTLPFAVRTPVLAFGGHFKNTVCVAHGTRAHLSAHVGELDSVSGREAIRAAIECTVRLAGTRPMAIAHDLHPDYTSTRVAEDFADEQCIAQRVGVQHHHAHVAACVAEYGLGEPVIGVVFDGAGLGSDDAIWGGEFLVVNGARFTRAGHLGYVPLPGGDAAARRPWACAAAHVAGVNARARASTTRPAVVAADEWNLVQQLVGRAGHTPRTSSVGRLFDAVASLAGLCHVASYEGEGAVALEAAAGSLAVSRYSVTFTGGATWTANPASIIEGVLSDLERGRSHAEVAAAFHGAVRDLVVLGCERIREDTGIEDVVLTGGVFMNALLLDSARQTLLQRRFRVFIPRLVPCNDGGLSLGQAYVAACALRENDSCA